VLGVPEILQPLRLILRHDFLNFRFMMSVRSLIYIVLFLTAGILSCKDNSMRKEEVFHAASSETQSIGGVSFELYNDSSYTILHSGGLGFTSYKGSYSIAGDTITLHNFEKQGPFKRNRLIVIRYDEQDSTYWMWKYNNSFGAATWEVYKSGDYHMGAGDVYQLDENNLSLRDEYHFTIALDKLKSGQSQK
jgi:hypothetical protein